jgi:hypothetical protein
MCEKWNLVLWIVCFLHILEQYYIKHGMHINCSAIATNWESHKVYAAKICKEANMA